MANGKTINRKLTGSYLALIRRFPLRPIQSEAALQQAQEVLDHLLSRDDLDDTEQDYLDVLGDLVENYEEKAHPIAAVSDAAMLRFLMDQKGVKQVQVARGAGIAESTISEVAAGKRKLNRTQIVKLARYFAVPPAAFIAGAQAH